MLYLGLFLNFFSSYIISSYAKNFLILFVSFFALIIFNIEFLSLFSGITALNIVLLSLIENIFFIIFWRYKKFILLKPDTKEIFKRIKNALILDKSLIVLSGAFLFLIIVSLILATFMPPLEPDSQTYHFFRAYEFVQNQNLLHFDTNDARALIMPINSEIFYTWLLSLKNNYLGFALLSFFSYISIVCSIFTILTHFKYSYRKILWTIFLLSSMSAIIIQMSSLQTDIVVGALLLLSVAIYLKSNNTCGIFFSSLAYSISLGVKSTGFISSFGFLFLIFGISYFIKNEKNLFNFLKFIGFSVLNFFIFSSYNYILNFIQFHNPLSNQANYISHKFWGGFKGFISNLIHFLFQSLDFTGFKWGFYLNDEILAFKNAVFNFIHINPLIGCNVDMEKVNIITDEQVVGFGILGFLVFLPAIFNSIFKIFFSKNKKIIFLSLLGITFLINIVVLSLSVAYMVFSIRFIVSFVCLSSCTLVLTYRKRSFLKPIIIFFMLFYMILISTHIKRMPFYRVVNLLIKDKFNIEKFTDDCYTGKITNVLDMAYDIKKIVKTRYKDAKKVGIFKTTHSAIFYLKIDKNVKYDFLNASKIDKYDLNSYDLLILETDVQDDNIFNSEDVIINYKIQGNKVIFNNDTKGVSCFYIAESNNPENSFSRKCFSRKYLENNTKYKLDYTQNIYINKKNRDSINLYYFKKI